MRIVQEGDEKQCCNMIGFHVFGEVRETLSE